MKKFFYLMFLGKRFFMMFLTSFPNNMVFCSQKVVHNPLLSVFPVVHLEAPCVGLRLMGILLRHDARLLLWDSAGLGGQ